MRVEFLIASEQYFGWSRGCEAVSAWAQVKLDQSAKCVFQLSQDTANSGRRIWVRNHLLQYPWNKINIYSNISSNGVCDLENRQSIQTRSAEPGIVGSSPEQSKTKKKKLENQKTKDPATEISWRKSSEFVESKSANEIFLQR